MERLAAHCQAAGIAIWYDYDLAAGDRFPAAIQARIDQCAAFIVILTPAAVASEWVDREIGYAVRRQKPVLPLLLARCPDHILLTNIHQEDVTHSAMPGEPFLNLYRANTCPMACDLRLC